MESATYVLSISVSSVLRFFCLDTHLQCMSLISMSARYPSNFESDWFHTKFTQLKLCFSLFCHWFYNLHKEMDTYICKEFYCSDLDVRNSPICIIFDIRSVLKGTVHAMSMTHCTGIITNVLFQHARPILNNSNWQPCLWFNYLVLCWGLLNPMRIM